MNRTKQQCPTSLKTEKTLCEAGVTQEGDQNIEQNSERKATEIQQQIIKGQPNKWTVKRARAIEQSRSQKYQAAQQETEINEKGSTPGNGHDDGDLIRMFNISIKPFKLPHINTIHKEINKTSQIHVFIEQVITNTWISVDQRNQGLPERTRSSNINRRKTLAVFKHCVRQANLAIHKTKQI